MNLSAPSTPETGRPAWIQSSLKETLGRDPFGLVTITQDRMAPALVPGLVARSERARYFSFYAFLLSRFSERRLELSEERLDAFIRYREWDMAAAVALCERTAVWGPGARARWSAD